VAAIVTGGGTGIGAAIAQRLAADGHAVAVMGRRPEPLQKVAGGLAEGLVVVGDVARARGDSLPPLADPELLSAGLGTGCRL
jgi:NAD(P)-dependent dehydrogenase (short-subunit alcohol dehydrogenase family)